MAVLKIRDRVSELVRGDELAHRSGSIGLDEGATDAFGDAEGGERDGADLFALDQPHAYGRRLSPGMMGALAGGVLFVFGLAVTALVHWHRGTKDAVDAPYAYLEIRAVDVDGRPVAGAAVTREGHGATELGVTDSFGEWRRFIRVRLGSSLALHFRKDLDGSGRLALAGVKTLDVPGQLPPDGELELTGNVQLVRTAMKGVPLERGKAGGAAVPPDGAAAVRIQTTNAQTAAELGDAPSAVWFYDESPEAPAVAALLPALEREARAQGLVVLEGASWRVRLKALTNPGAGQRGLLLVQGSRVESGFERRAFAFVRTLPGPKSTAEVFRLAAQGTLQVAALHTPRRVAIQRAGRESDEWRVADPDVAWWRPAVGRPLVLPSGARATVVRSREAGATGSPLIVKMAAKAAGSSPCAGAPACTAVVPRLADVAPVSGWRRLGVRVAGVTGEVEVFGAGFAARQREDGVFEFWGKPKGAVVVTVVQGGRLLWRGNVPAVRTVAPTRGKGAALPVVRLPGSVAAGMAGGAARSTLR
jgi:hypothetical protein